MANYTTADIKQLREETGAGMMDVKKALDASDGDHTVAKEWLKQKGLAKAEKRAADDERATGEGYVGSYVHATGKVATLVEVLCETDFVARNDEFRQLVTDIAMHVAAMQPSSVEDLLSQEFIKDPDQTIEEMVKGLSGKIGEKFVVNRFIRYQIGE